MVRLKHGSETSHQLGKIIEQGYGSPCSPNRTPAYLKLGEREGRFCEVLLPGGGWVGTGNATVEHGVVEQGEGGADVTDFRQSHHNK